MGGYKIGSYSYPSLKFERALEINKMICDPPYKGQLSQSGLAQALDKMSETGGAFINLVGSLRDYGLVQGKGALTATDLAKRIVAGTAEEAAEAKAEAFLNVPLFKQIYQRIGINIPPEEAFSVLLGEITQEDKLKLQERSKNVLNFYMEGVRYLRPVEGGKGMESLRPTGVQTSATAALTLRDLGGTMNLTVDRTPDNVEILITALQNFKKRLEAESKLENSNKGEK